jgi:hypothetical protein
LIVFDFSKDSFHFKADQTRAYESCFADSGGPADLKIKDDFVLLGVASAVLSKKPRDLPTQVACTRISFFNSTFFIKNGFQKVTKKFKAVNHDSLLYKLKNLIHLIVYEKKGTQQSPRTCTFILGH